MATKIFFNKFFFHDFYPSRFFPLSSIFLLFLQHIFFFKLFRGEDPSTNRYGLWVCESLSQSVSPEKVWNLQYLALDIIRWHQIATDDIIWYQTSSDDIRWHQITSEDIRWHHITTEDIRCHWNIQILRYWNIEVLDYLDIVILSWLKCWISRPQMFSLS